MQEIEHRRGSIASHGTTDAHLSSVSRGEMGSAAFQASPIHSRIVTGVRAPSGRTVKPVKRPQDWMAFAQASPDGHKAVLCDR